MVHKDLKSWMFKRGLRPADLARLAGVSSATASRWLRGLRVPSEDKRMVIEKITKKEIPAGWWATEDEKKRAAFLASVK